MNFIELTEKEALEMESQGMISIIDASPTSLDTINHERGLLWKENFRKLCLKVHHLPITKVIDFFKPRYIVCINSITTDNDSSQYTWRYLYGLENKQIQDKTSRDTEFVYVLTNPQYTNLVKIGMTTDNVVNRVNSINGTGTVSEWQPVFALPVQPGTAYQIEQAVHKHFNKVRVSSNKGSKREFFEISVFAAIDKVREIGTMFQVGEPIIFN